MKKPIIGLMLAQIQSPIQGATHNMQYINETYFRGIEAAGGIPLGIPLMECLEDMEPLLEMCDGFLLPGGEDVDPRCYGEHPHKTLGTVNYVADQAWISVVNVATEQKKPVFGICRGHQLVNVALGGSLYQDLSLMEGASQTHQQRQSRDYPLHEVRIAPTSKLALILGTESVYTNTLHHQCVKMPGEGLSVVAHSADGVPEALENDDGSIVLVQWHPEDLRSTVPCMCKLFENLISCSKARMIDK